MSKFFKLSVLIFLLAGVGMSSTTNAQWQPTTLKDNRFSAEFGVKLLDRPGDELGLPLISDRPTNATLFDASQASDLGGAVGAEVKFNFETGFGRELEFRTILADWSEDATQISGPDLVSPFFPVAGSEPTDVSYGYGSDYFSVELMARRAVRPGVTFMFGPRIISTKDQVTLSGSLTVNPVTGGAPITVTQTTVTEATNILLGGQTGFEFNLPVNQSVWANAYIRAGGYFNPTEVNQSVANNTSLAPPITNTATENTGSFMAEVGGRVYVDLLPNAATLYVGYEANWIDGIALAPAQLLTDFTTNGIETTTTPFFHAVTAGIRVQY